MKKKVGVERERHEGDTGGDLGPEGVDQVVEVGECVQLQRQMRLVQHRQHTPRRAHYTRRHRPLIPPQLIRSTQTPTQNSKELCILSCN